MNGKGLVGMTLVYRLREMETMIKQGLENRSTSDAYLERPRKNMRQIPPIAVRLP